MKMDILLKPADLFLSRLSLLQKFLLIVLLYAIPVSYVAYFTLTERFADIEEANSERETVEILQTLSPIMIYMAQERGINHMLRSGSKNAVSKLLQAQTQLDEQLTTARQTIDSASLQDLFARAKQQIPELKFKLRQLRQDKEQPAPVIFERYSQLIAEFQRLIRQTILESDLMTETDHRGAFRIKLLFELIPQLREITGQIRGLGAGAATAGSINAKQTITLTRKLAKLEDLYQQTTFLLDQLNQREKPSAETLRIEGDFKQKYDAFITLTENQLLTTKNININPHSYFTRGTEAISAISEVAQVQTELFSQFLTDKSQQLRHQAWINMSSSSALIIAALVIFLSFYRTTILAVSDISRGVEAIADGDLTVRFKQFSHDEIGLISVHLNRMAEKVGQLVAKVRLSAEQLVSNAQINFEATEATHQQVNGQTQEVEMVATAVNEMAASVQEVSNNVQQTAEASQIADQESLQGKAIVENTIQSISELAEELNRAANSISELQGNVNEITTVLDVIQGIADQTNLLALNAAIEAARAGESGRGFAVVADEVRTLASKTQQSTEEIRQMINKLNESASASVTAIHAGNEQSQKTVEDAQAAGQALSRITESVSHISLMSEQISTASVQQATVAEEINQSIIRVKNLAEQTDATANHSAEVSRELQEIASQLEKLIESFRV